MTPSFAQCHWCKGEPLGPDVGLSLYTTEREVCGDDRRSALHIAARIGVL